MGVKPRPIGRMGLEEVRAELDGLQRDEVRRLALRERERALMTRQPVRRFVAVGVRAAW